MSERRRRFGNIAALVAAYGSGQGALFLAQTSLVARGQLAQLGEFGTTFVFVTLFYQLVDWGGILLLAREVLDTRRPASQTWKLFWSFSAIRAVIAGAIILASIGIRLLFGANFWTSFFLMSSGGLFFVAFNVGGLLDGLSLSGWNGVAGAIPFLATAMALPYCSGFHDKSSAGAVLGLTYAIGSVVGVILQSAILRMHFEPRGMQKPEWRKGMVLAREGGVYFLTWIPGQLFFRGQIAISASMFGTASTGLFVYAKQIITAASQVISFARRSEFPNVVKILAVSRRSITNIVGQQLFSLTLSLAAAVTMCVAIGLFWRYLPGRFQEAAILTIAFIPAFLATCVLAAVMQASAALRELRFAAEASIIALLFVGLAMSFLLAKPWHLFGMAAAECVANLLAFSIIVVRLRIIEASK